MNRVPPSSRPPGRAAQADSAQAQRAKKRPTLQMEKAKPVKSGQAQGADGGAESPEAALWGGKDIDRSLEVSAKEVEARLAEAEAGEAGGAENAEEAGEAAEAAKESEHDEHGSGKPGSGKEGGWGSKLAKLTGRALLQRHAAQQAKGAQAGPNAQSAQKQQGAAKPQSAARPSAPAAQPSKLTASSYEKLAPVSSVKANAITGNQPRLDRPPDAFTLLRDAKERGVLFQEDSQREGHAEEKEDPELAAAVEETIRLMFGVRGVLRIGPGKNDAQDPIIVVVATQGFTDASFSKVPEKVHRFPTLVAIPFDLLPLKRER